MTHHPVITGSLLGVAVALAVICSIGLLVMRDAYQRLHFSAPVVTISMLLIVIAVFLEEPDAQARIKVVLIFVFMTAMNSVLCHATARAIRIRQVGGLAPLEREQIPVVPAKGIAGAGKFAGDRT
ncbi:MAG: monovalent cation/H(+) antiporter subunit G [Tepidisphaeraceae bacterium]|jgi:monovalent cation/proton antiporter MnhG/PhaG subunit